MARASRRPRRAAAIRWAVVVALIGYGGSVTASCGVQGAPAVPPPTPVVTTVGTVAAQAPVDRYVALAEQVYDTEARGAAARRELRHVAGDPGVRRLLRSGDDAGLRRHVTGMFRSRWFPDEHVSRLRILPAGRVPLDLGVPWVVSPMLQRTLTLSGGRQARIQVAVQDVIGYVRAMHNKHPAVQIVVRDATGRHAVSLLGPAARAPLPPTGFATVAGTRYAVRSFSRLSFLQAPAPVTVWVLLPVSPPPGSP